MTALVEIRSYRLKAGSFETFARLFEDDALPMLAEAGIDVVAFGRSADDPNAAFLIRAFGDLDDRAARENEFYGSAAWRDGPRSRILACIDDYLDTVLTLDDRTIDGLRTAGVKASAERAG